MTKKHQLIKVGWANNARTRLGLRTHNGAYALVWRFTDRSEAIKGRAIADRVEHPGQRRDYIKAVRVALKEAGFASSAKPYPKPNDTTGGAIVKTINPAEEYKRCDLCASCDITSQATHETTETHTEFAGSLLRHPRQLYYCAVCTKEVVYAQQDTKGKPMTEEK